MPHIGLTTYVRTAHIETGNDIGHHESRTSVFVGIDEAAVDEAATVWVAAEIANLARKHLDQHSADDYEDAHSWGQYDLIITNAAADMDITVHYGPQHVDTLDG